MFYGFVITEAGNQLLAKMVAGQTLKLSGVFMDLGTVEDKETARQLIAPWSRDRRAPARFPPSRATRWA